MPPNKTCIECLNSFSPRLATQQLIVCPSCGCLISNTISILKFPPMPADWSFIKIGTTGKDIDKTFEVIGRVRLQLRNEYKNYWVILYANGSMGFLYESFGSFAILGSNTFAYTDDVRKLKAGCKIKKDKTMTLTGEFVEKCESISYEGEVNNWKEFSAGFFVVQASSDVGYLAVFHIINSNEVHYFYGKKMSLENLALQNILKWDEWS